MKAVLNTVSNKVTIENLYNVIIKGSAIFLGLLGLAMIAGIFNGNIH